MVILMTQGLADWIIWGSPFTEIKEYISHNIHHRFDYTVAPWYSYLLVILGVLIPPVSIFLFTGYFKSWKKHLILFLPTLLFLIFHSYYPNKQERFILPVLPFIIILGLIGWQMIYTHSGFLKRWNVLVRGSWIFFWSVNVLLLVFFTGMYSKRARVESMSYLSRYADIKLIVVDDSQRAHATMLPLFYLGQWPEVWSVSENHPVGEIQDKLATAPGTTPSFVLFFGKEDLEKRVEDLRSYMPGLTPEKVIAPSLPDKIMHWLNPVNANREIYIYRNITIDPS
jgi:hypothetical protein